MLQQHSFPPKPVEGFVLNCSFNSQCVIIIIFLFKKKKLFHILLTVNSVYDDIDINILK